MYFFCIKNPVCRLLISHHAFRISLNLRRRFIPAALEQQQKSPFSLRCQRRKRTYSAVPLHLTMAARQHLAHLIPVTAGYRSSLLQFSLTTPGPVHLSSATVLHHPTALSMLPADYSSLSQSFDMQLKLIIDKRTAIVNQQFRQIIWLYLHCRQNARLCTKQITDLFLSCLLHSDILFLQPLLHHLAQQLISHGEQRHTQQHAQYTAQTAADDNTHQHPQGR